MKNREKFRDEILEAFEGFFNYETNSACRFMKKQVIPNYDLENRVKEGTCGGLTCIDCSKMFAFWLEEEYVEPQKVDWSKVPVDTLVMVKDFEREEWVLRYFKGIDENCEESKYMTWIAGSTSKTAYGFTEYWNYCELVEDEDE